MEKWATLLYTKHKRVHTHTQLKIGGVSHSYSVSEIHDQEENRLFTPITTMHLNSAITKNVDVVYHMVLLELLRQKFVFITPTSNVARATNFST